MWCTCPCIIFIWQLEIVVSWYHYMYMSLSSPKRGEVIDLLMSKILFCEIFLLQVSKNIENQESDYDHWIYISIMKLYWYNVSSNNEKSVPFFCKLFKNFCQINSSTIYKPFLNLFLHLMLLRCVQNIYGFCDIILMSCNRFCFSLLWMTQKCRTICI